MLDVFPTLTPDDYERRRPAIEENLERAALYATPEDYIYQYILEPRWGRPTEL